MARQICEDQLFFEKWSAIATLLATVATVTLLAFMYLFLGNKPLPIGAGTVTPLNLFWKLIVPLVPVILLVVPALWRNICPLAFFNISGHRLRTVFDGSPKQTNYRLRLAERSARLWLSRNGLYVAILLLYILVPARLLVLNLNAQVLDILLLLLAIATFVCGIMFPFKSGWCSSICPVFPVESFYGMSPLVHLDNTLCIQKASELSPRTLCSGCTRRCLDLRIGRQAGAAKGNRQEEWHPSKPLLIFFRLFPGFVLAYGLLDTSHVVDSVAAGWLPLLIYATFAVFMVVSAAASALLAKFLSGQSRPNRRYDKGMGITLVAITFYVYYWFAIPQAVNTIRLLSGMNNSLIYPVESALLIGAAALTIGWLYRANQGISCK